MKSCTFFGHRDYNGSQNAALAATVEELITRDGVTDFSVGNQGNFDRAVLRTLREMKVKYPQIRYSVVLAYLPTKENDSPLSPEETTYPEGIEKVPRRFAISYRNRLMVKSADVGGAAQFTSLALRQGKTVINLAERGK